jgi:hypothetical protein
MNANIEPAFDASRRRNPRLTTVTATVAAEPNGPRNIDDLWLLRGEDDERNMGT